MFERVVALALLAALADCSTVHMVKKSVLGGPLDPGEHLKGFIGGVVADEPMAALAAREVLATGGTAADAAVTLGFMLSATLPSRASLGGGGACIAYQPGSKSPGGGVPEAVLFVPQAPAAVAGDRPAAVPLMARGLYLLSARYGSKPFEDLVAPAQRAAASGFNISRAFARDLTQVRGPLIADPATGAVLAPGGVPLGEGAVLVQPDLAATLGQIRVAGVGDMYQGLLALRLVQASADAGGPFTMGDLRNARAVLGQPIVVKAGVDQVAFLPPPADGGLGAAAAFLALARTGTVNQSLVETSVGSVAQWRAKGGDPLALLQSPPSSGSLPALPASTSFAVLDRHGGAVACALTMENLFGTGRTAPGTGIILGASPAIKPPAMLTAAVAWNSGRDAFRAAVGASGQNAAALAGAVAMGQALAGDLPPAVPVPDPGRANAIGCPAYVPGGDTSCRFATDVRGAGLSAGAQ